MNRIVIFAPNWLGDAVMALPAIADIRRELPQAIIAVAAKPSIASLFEMVTGVDEIVAIENGLPKDGSDGSAKYEAAILLPNSFRSALVARQAGIAERWGYRADWRGLLLTRAIARPSGPIHQIDYYQRLTSALGFPSGPNAPRLDAPPSARAAGTCALERAGWDRQEPFVVLAPGAAYGGAKRWPADRFAALARQFHELGFRAVLIGSSADVPTGRTLESALDSKVAVLNLIGRTNLPALAGVLSMARALVSNDSGALHLGAALGLPVTAIFGPTDERRTGPRGMPIEEFSSQSSGPPVTLTTRVWCRPCMLRECPIDHRCMRRISVDAVLEATKRMLSTA
jgi:heptosyltransferase II